MQNTGSIDERGYLRGMDRRGYSPPKCILELVANSLDSLDKVLALGNFVPSILFDVARQTISQIDNGCGMLLNNVNNMFAMHRENHSDEPSRGVSGIGAKPALSILSGKSLVVIDTHAQDGPYLRITVPWDTIHSTGKYTGMVQIRPMSEAEQAEFIREREENGMLNGGRAHGTSTRFKYRDDLNYLLEGNFNPITSEAALKNPLDRIGIVFGHDNVKMTFKSYQTPDKLSDLQQYNYFDAPNADFYTGVSEHTIRHYRCDKDDHDRFLLTTDDGPMEIIKNGRGLTLLPEKISTGLHGYRVVGDFKVVCGLRLDNAIFNPDAPVELGASKNTGAFNEAHLGDNELFLGSYKLVRNNQVIGLIPQPDISLGSARGGGNTYLDYILVQTEIQFNPVSKQDNYQDIITGIQENKNQFDGANVPKQLTRLVSYVKKMKAREIRHYFTGCIERHAPVPLVEEELVEPVELPDNAQNEDEEYVQHLEQQEEEQELGQEFAVESDDDESTDESPITTRPERPPPVEDSTDTENVLNLVSKMLDSKRLYTKFQLQAVFENVLAVMFGVEED